MVLPPDTISPGYFVFRCVPSEHHCGFGVTPNENRRLLRPSKPFSFGTCTRIFPMSGCRHSSSAIVLGACVRIMWGGLLFFFICPSNAERYACQSKDRCASIEGKKREPDRCILLRMCLLCALDYSGLYPLYPGVTF